LSPAARVAVDTHLRVIDVLDQLIAEQERALARQATEDARARWLQTVPGVGAYSAMVILAEIGDIARFRDKKSLASYAGLVPRVHSSGGRTWHGKTSPQANHYLRWAFVEAANAILLNRQKYADQHVIELYDRLQKHKCHGKAAVAVARHLAEASWWILTKREPYRPPRAQAAAMSSSRNG